MMYAIPDSKDHGANMGPTGHTLQVEIDCSRSFCYVIGYTDCYFLNDISTPIVDQFIKGLRPRQNDYHLGPAFSNSDFTEVC